MFEYGEWLTLVNRVSYLTCQLKINLNIDLQLSCTPFYISYFATRLRTILMPPFSPNSHTFWDTI